MNILSLYEHCVFVYEVWDIAIRSIELGAVNLLELFPPNRVTGPVLCSKLGFRPSFAVDLSECQPYGRNAGEYWDLNETIDVKEPQEMVDCEEPSFRTGSPPFDFWSHLPKISAHRREPKKVDLQRQVGAQNLHPAMLVRKHQCYDARYFLHEHPGGADSWDAPQMIAFQNLPGVFTEVGPMCHWDTQVTGLTGRAGAPRKQTKWGTNSPVLANTLDV